MFGFTAFSETSVADDGFVRTDPFAGALVIIHFNKDVLTFRLNINKQHDYSLKINKMTDFALEFNKQTDFDLQVNKIINFKARR
jgi:hypothetical protein